MTPRSLCYILLGYLSGSVLFAKLALALFGKEDALRDSCDENPGTANAFQCGGLLCGLMTLSGDLLKGYLPMRLYLAPDRVLLLRQPVFALVLLAPVLGTVLPVFSHFRGGKGIAVTFGCLLGLFPECRPLLAFTGSFLLFTLVIEITPNFYRPWRPMSSPCRCCGGSMCRHRCSQASCSSRSRSASGCTTAPKNEKRSR